MAIERVMDAIAAHLGARSARGAPGQSLRARARRHALSHDRSRTMSRRRSSPSWRKAPAMPRAAPRWRRSTPATRILKKGLALTPVKFGISFTTTHLNQAGALVLVYADGSIHLNHGGTEMGQGLMIKVAQVVADVFAVPIDSVKISATRTDKVPNTSATAASSGADLNGMAARIAAETIRERLDAFAATAAGRRRGLDLRRALPPRPSRPHLARRDRLLRDAGHPLRPRRPSRPPLPLFRLWRGAQRGRDRHAHRRAQGRRGRHPPRRRPLAQPGDRPRADRGRLHPGHGLADHRGAGLRRARPPAHPRALHLQDPDRQRPPGADGDRDLGARARMPSPPSTAPRRSASRL